MTPIAALSTRFLATDPRADDGLREISIAAEAVAINRRVSGVKMRLSVPMAHFRGVALSVLENARGFLFRVALVHPDPELDVILAESDCEEEIGKVWRDWAQALRLPLIARSATGYFSSASLISRGLRGSGASVASGTRISSASIPA